jgi:hypothetical protein
VTEIGQLFETETLEGYVDRSGFSSLTEWVAEIFKLHKSDTFRDFYLYRVEADTRVVF